MILNRSIVNSLLLACATCLTLFITGCGGSDEAERENKNATPNATTVMTQQINDLKNENASLKQQVEKLQQDNRTLTARAAELETQLAEGKEKASAVPTHTEAPPPAETAKPAPTGNSQETYDEGMSLYHQRNFSKALTNFQSVADGGSQLSDRGQYWAGECQYALKDYQSAIESFQKVLGFSRSTKKDDAQMMIANSYFALGQKDKARDAYQTLISKFPASPFVKRAKARLNQL